MIWRYTCRSVTRTRHESRPFPTVLGGVPVQVEAEVLDISVQFRPRRQLVVSEADASGELILRFVNFYGSQIKQLERARDERQRLRIFGEIAYASLVLKMVHPRYRVVVAENDAPLQSLTPVYPTTAGVSQTPCASRSQHP